VQPPDDAALRQRLSDVVVAHGAVENDVGFLVSVPQTGHEGEAYDRADRIQVGASLLSELLSAGL